LGAEPFMETLLAKKPRDRVLTIADDTEAIEAECEEAGHEQGAEHGEEPAHAGHHHDGHNPHVWASPIQAAREVRTLARKLAAADPARADRYHANAEHYAKRLESLGERMKSAAKGFKGRNIVTFHDAFAYLARDLELNVVATLTVDPQNGASASQMGELDRVIREKGVVAIFYEPAYSDATAKTLARQTGVPAFPLNPFNYTKGTLDVAAYERVMEENLKTLEQALGNHP
jgi:ABC-type Zn uptake system ZnuABC Zn-binding protein ZnuA